ncbi:MAG: hypothetical protein A2Y02_02765 [Omnitrophica bacterium GWA2_52_12]|nr:MAG: hypothetical protein A2Y02_02765 [Omnitrophica bacterium GWA2_52_12]
MHQQNDPTKKILDSIKAFSGQEAKKAFMDSLEKVGVHQVKHKIETNYWSSSQSAGWAREWLELKEAPEEIRRREEELNILRESNSIAKDANEIAKKANAKSDKANRLSALAIFVSLLAALIAWLVK